jgi:prepilin peptidase dependent protein B
VLINYLRRKQLGFTFTEVMMSLVINTILLLALMAIFVANLQHYRKTLATNQLNEQLQSAMQVMSNEIRRAGYSAAASNNVASSQNTNAFMATGVDISVNGANNCILFAYDRNGNGTLPAISSSSDDERYGFRLLSGALQTRPPGGTFDCTATATNWDNLTDTNVMTVTNLTFSLTQQSVASGTSSLALRSVDITLSGRLVNDTAVTATLTQHVRIRNDKFIP